MSDTQPFVREAGSGPGVVCIHCNASTSAQWRALAERLAPRHRVFAPDTYGAGKSIDWHSPTEIALLDEIRFMEPVLAAAGEPFTLVGHSYGAAVALIAACQSPGRVGRLVVYEPSLFSLVDAQAPPPNSVDGIRDVVRAAAAALDAGDKDAAAMHFIDFWMGTGSWAGTPAQRRPAIAESVANIRRWSHALFSEPTPLQAFASLDIPVLYMLGAASTEPARAVSRLLIPVLPRVRVVEFPDLGHMGPITHPEIVNAEIDRFLGEA